MVLTGGCQTGGENHAMGEKISPVNRGRGLLLLLICILLLPSCAPRFSKQVMSEADPALTLRDVLRDPDRYKGKVLLVGGEIVRTAAQEGESWVEAVQQALDWRQRPKDIDISEGRFLVRFEDFRDPAVYAPGRKITVVGRVQGKRVQPLNQMAYTYPVLIPLEAYLWPRESGAGPFFHFGIGVGGVFR